MLTLYKRRTIPSASAEAKLVSKSNVRLMPLLMLSPNLRQRLTGIISAFALEKHASSTSVRLKTSKTPSKRSKVNTSQRILHTSLLILFLTTQSNFGCLRNSLMFFGCRFFFNNLSASQIDCCLFWLWANWRSFQTSFKFGFEETHFNSFHHRPYAMR